MDKCKDLDAIIPRDIHFPVNAVTERDWFDKDPFRSAYCDALSVLFPLGERFFIRSVQHYLDQIKDSGLREEVRAFCIQEAYHTREHEVYNQRLANQGVDVALMEESVKKSLSMAKHPITKLAATVAIEHLTATFAHMVISDPKLFEKADPVFRNLWTWHALEEMEHKAVAYDVFLEATKGVSSWKRYMLRCVSMISVTTELHRVQISHLVTIMRLREQSTGIGMWLKFLWLFFFIPGFYRKSLLYYLRIYIPGFHPWKKGDNDLLAIGRARLERFLVMSPDDSDNKIKD